MADRRAELCHRCGTGLTTCSRSLPILTALGRVEMRLAQQPRAGPRDGLSAVGGQEVRMGDKLTVQEFPRRRTRRLADAGDRAARARYRTRDFAKALEPDYAVGEAAEEMNHHPGKGVESVIGGTSSRGVDRAGITPSPSSGFPPTTGPSGIGPRARWMSSKLFWSSFVWGMCVSRQGLSSRGP